MTTRLAQPVPPDQVRPAATEPPPSTGPRPDLRSAAAWLLAHARRRRWALVAILVFTVVSLAFTFLWGPVVRHQPLWVVPGDVWTTFRVAHLVGWGDIGGIYDPGDGLLTFPGIVVTLAPVAMLSGHFGLTESFGFFTVQHPSAWFLLGPATLLLGAACLVAFDAMAEELGATGRTRVALLAAESCVVFQVVAIWGHPEDMLATGLAVYAVLAGSRRRWVASGWLWGVAVAFQPLVLVLVPLGVAVTPAGQRIRLLVRAALPSAALLVAPLATRWSMTTHVLLHQENFPKIDHATPWIALTSTVAGGGVTSGTGRILALLAAVGLGVLAWRRPPTPLGLLWLGGLALSLRCFFESVMVPFYLGPPCAVVLLVCAVRGGRVRLLVAFGASMAATVLSFHHLSEWDYWLPMVGLLGVALACAWPGRAAFRTSDVATVAPAVATEPGGGLRSR